ncbi:MAG: hypothetical protein FWH36_06180 [Lentimicrobiaceae bacterium]|nr:hypothetical protein [Lentimicrobiaceae bacterium]
MKKVILFAALSIGCVAFANARVSVNADNVSTVQVTNGDYKEVALTDCPEVIQVAVKNLAGDVYDVKKVEFDAETELTKVAFVNKEDGTEKTVILDKEGKEKDAE